MSRLPIPSLRQLADDYVASLHEGSTIQDEDQSIIQPFRHLIPALLAKKGLALAEMTGGGHVVVAAPWLLMHMTAPPLRAVAPALGPPEEHEGPVWCTACDLSWFDSACPHGLRYVVDLGNATVPWVQRVVGLA
jgi:hypothetical protein